MIPKHSLAMVLTAERKLEPRDIPIPEAEDDSAILRIEACGICGSDYEQFEGVLRTPMPVIPGHEPLGIIERIGDSAASRWGVDVGVTTSFFISFEYFISSFVAACGVIIFIF